MLELSSAAVRVRPPFVDRLASVTESDFPVLRALAEEIWRQHYANILPPAQIDCMLMNRCND